MTAFPSAFITSDEGDLVAALASFPAIPGARAAHPRSPSGRAVPLPSRGSAPIRPGGRCDPDPGAARAAPAAGPVRIDDARARASGRTRLVDLLRPATSSSRSGTASDRRRGARRPSTAAPAPSRTFSTRCARSPTAIRDRGRSAHAARRRRAGDRGRRSPRPRRRCGSCGSVAAGRVALVTDAIAGRRAGRRGLCARRRRRDRRDGVARRADGVLAGSVLTMIDAVRNLVELGVPLDGRPRPRRSVRPVCSARRRTARRPGAGPTWSCSTTRSRSSACSSEGRPVSPAEAMAPPRVAVPHRDPRSSPPRSSGSCRTRRRLRGSQPQRCARRDTARAHGRHGSSDNAASYGVYAFGLLPRWTALRDSITLTVHYDTPLDLSGSTVIGLSQSGQTPDVVEYVVPGPPERGLHDRDHERPDVDPRRRGGGDDPAGAEPELAVAATKTYVNTLGSAGAARRAYRRPGSGDRGRDPRGGASS